MLYTIDRTASLHTIALLVGIPACHLHYLWRMRMGRFALAGRRGSTKGRSKGSHSSSQRHTTWSAKARPYLQITY